MAASGLPGFRDLPGLIAEHARARPEAIALRCGEHALSYGQLDTRMDQVAAALQRDGLQATQCIAICASASIDYLAVFCGALRAGVAVAPLAPGSTALANAGHGCSTPTSRVADAARRRAGHRCRAPTAGPATRRRLRWLAGSARAAAPVGRHRARLALQHHLFLGHHRHAQGHRPAARDALGAHPRAAVTGYGPTASRWSRRRSTPTPRWSASSRRWRAAEPVVLMPQVRRASSPELSPSATASRTPCWCRCSTGG